MIVSLYGCSGGRSEPQSKNGLITTLVIVWPRESSIGRSPDAESSCSATAMSYEKSCGPCLKSPSNALPYGSSSSLLGSHRCPAAGSHGPWTRKPYRCPGVTAGTYACQTKPSTSSRGMRSSVPRLSIRHSSTCSATLENTEKLVPAPSYVAPSGYGVPGHTVARIGPVSGFVSLGVIIRPYRRRSKSAHPARLGPRARVEARRDRRDRRRAYLARVQPGRCAGVATCGRGGRARGLADSDSERPAGRGP